MVEAFLKAYGPMTFGVVALLILWKFIVAPALAQGKVDATAMQLLANSMKDTAESATQAAQINQDTAQTLRVVTERLVTLSENMVVGVTEDKGAK